ncbi:MAG: hypothetical protein US25_C0055G0004 [Candidatus Moranbacteria bacterium GW2011_GWE1_36_7]|nr:MAG: hypothetical protein US25_C0055G0004 [Candidatus Moranbacteria bacterium GW2011_GWE1_36_7]
MIRNKYMENIEKEIELIKKRNKSVELDKSWEKSWTRRIFIAAITYIIALMWMRTIGESLIFLKACIPTGGYLLSTLSLPFIKKWWIDVK